MADVDATITISIAANSLKATADFTPAEGEGKHISVEEAMRIIADSGVVAGVSEDNVRTLCASTRPLRSVIIAEAIRPGIGENARIEPYVNISKRAAAKERDDGSVDYHDLGEITSVGKDQQLYRRIPPQFGNPGTDVCGRDIPGLPGKDIRIVLGNGTVIDENDPDLVVSTLEGEIILKNGVLHISELHEVKGDVDFSTGNVVFKGSVKINGTVRAGFSVEAGGSIQINGNVEDATVIGGTDVTILGGLVGNGQGFVKAGRDVFLKFVENQHVDAERDIFLNGVAYHAHLRAGRSIIAKGGKGTIVGGEASAKYSVDASRFGSVACVPTIIKTGIDPALAERLKALDDDIAQTRETSEKIEQSIIFVYKIKIDKGQLPPDKAALLEKLETARKGLPEKLEQLQEQRSHIMNDQESIEKAYASADIGVFPKVRVYIGNQFITVEDTLGPSSFRMFEGDVIRLSK